MAVIIGSYALDYWYPGEGLWDTACSDIDIVVSKEERTVLEPLLEGSRVEWHDVDYLNNKQLEQRWASRNTREVGRGAELPVMSLTGLAILKRSHLWKDYKWNMHMSQYHTYLAKYLWANDEVSDWKERQALTIKEWKGSSPNLNQSNKNFFDDPVAKRFDHDWLHELVAYYDKPIYTELKYPGKEGLAWCEKELWNALPLEKKLRCVAEEAHVIACERFCIPKDWGFPTRLAYIKSLRKVCTTLTSGWFRDFAIDHYFILLNHYYDKSKFDKVKENTQNV